MTKIMLVEDDKSLREIYGVRLLAEGYDIVSAGDGEEALAMAIKERPRLIISDVMMPKISGFDMLDILRSTTETKDIQVIMMTALSSDEQRARGQSLGADRYLVKSQVGIEDVVQVVHEILQDKVTASEEPAATQPAPAAAPAPVSAPVSAPTPIQQTAPAPTPITVSAPAPAPVAAPIAPAPNPSPIPPPPQAPVSSGFTFQSGPQSVSPSSIPQPTPVPARPPAAKPAGSSSKIIQPIANPNTPDVNFSDLLDKELAKEAGVDENNRPNVETIAQEKAEISEQMNQFIATPAPSSLPPSPVVDLSDKPEETIPTISVSEDGSVMPQQIVPPRFTPPAGTAAPEQTPPQAPAA